MKRVFAPQTARLVAFAQGAVALVVIVINDVLDLAYRDCRQSHSGNCDFHDACDLGAAYAAQGGHDLRYKLRRVREELVKAAVVDLAFEGFDRQNGLLLGRQAVLAISCGLLADDPLKGENKRVDSVRTLERE